MHRFLYWLTFGILAALLFCRPLLAQNTIPITGHLGDASQGIPSGQSVKFELYNCGANLPRVFASFGIVRQNFTLTPDSTGLLTGKIIPNDVINCGGVTGTTRYYITPLLNGIPQIAPACYAVLSTMGVFNLDVATPCASATPPPPPGGPFDATYFNLNVLGLLTVNNANFTGNVNMTNLTVQNYHFASAPNNCPAGQYSIGLNINFVTQCLPLPSVGIPVTSVFHRVGDVVAQPGDYSCGMITGAICSLPTVNYQQIRVANVPIMPARSIVNLLGGPGASINCGDNAITLETDCTWQAQVDSATFCNTNGCIFTKADGTIVQWGSVSVVANTQSKNSASITFAQPFPSAAQSVTLTILGRPRASVNDVGESQLNVLSTSGASVDLQCSAPVGGGGCTFDNNITLMWQAIGK